MIWLVEHPTLIFLSNQGYRGQVVLERTRMVSPSQIPDLEIRELLNEFLQAVDFRGL